MPDPNTTSAVPHPVKDIVLPLAVVIGLVVNALVIGIAWGKFSYRIEINERAIAAHEESSKQENSHQNQSIQSLRDRVHDLERDTTEHERRFLMLDDYTRGRIDRLPYKPPPPARW